MLENDVWIKLPDSAQSLLSPAQINVSHILNHLLRIRCRLRASYFRTLQIHSSREAIFTF